MKLSFQVKKDVSFVFNYLTDMQKFVSVHPVIHQIDLIGDGRYLVHETLKFGFLPFSFTYPVSIEKDELSRTVVIRATVFGLTGIKMCFVLQQEGEYTCVEEEIAFKSPLPVKRMMGLVFRKQHAQLFKNMEMRS